MVDYSDASYVDSFIMQISTRNAISKTRSKGARLTRYFIKSLHTLPDYIGTASDIGQQDVKGGLTPDRTVSRTVNGGHPAKRQTWTKVKGVVSVRVRVVRL